MTRRRFVGGKDVGGAVQDATGIHLRTEVEV